jgi:hypothetical protein
MKPGPKRERFKDGPYLHRMARLIDEKKITAWRAAQLVIDGALAGNSDYAKARRLLTKFLDRFGKQPIEETLASFRLRSALLEVGKRAQEAAAPMLEYLEQLRRSGDIEKIPLMWDDEQFMAEYGALPLHRALERWNYLHPARGRRNYLQTRNRTDN